MRTEGLLNSLYDLGVSQKVKKYTVLLGTVNCVMCPILFRTKQGLLVRESFGNTQETRANHGSVCPGPVTVVCGDVDNSPVDSTLRSYSVVGGTCG